MFTFVSRKNQGITQVKLLQNVNLARILVEGNTFNILGNSGL